MTKPRLVSLDVFRGATVAAMILVNNPGSWDHIYWPLEHADWDGCTPTDLIMPFFLFIVGVSIVYAMDSRKQQGGARLELVQRAAVRAVKLLLLGWSLALFPTSHAAVQQVLHSPIHWLATMRVMGVLQRIAIVYFACALIFVFSEWRTWVTSCAIILIAYWAALRWIPVPGTNGIWIGPNLGAETNLGAWLDRLVLTPQHLYKHSTWDPEGLLSTTSAIGSGLIGMLIGHYLRRSESEPPVKVAWLFTAGVLLTIAGWIWSLGFPLNKQLWTSSFTLYTGGLATIFLAASYWIVDANSYRRFTQVPVAFGVNAITAFWGSGMMVRLLMLWQVRLNGQTIGIKDYIYRKLIEPVFSSANFASMVGAIVFLGIWSAIVLLMYRMKWFIKV
jgi:predicted acyltransferase